LARRCSLTPPVRRHDGSGFIMKLRSMGCEMQKFSPTAETGDLAQLDREFKGTRFRKGFSTFQTVETFPYMKEAFASFQSLLVVPEFPKKPSVLISIKLQILSIYKNPLASPLIPPFRKTNFSLEKYFRAYFPAFQSFTPGGKREGERWQGQK